MQWECLTSTQFVHAVRETGLCVLPVGVLEQHGNHLPLGTDYRAVHAVAVAAADIEPAVVFPGYYLADAANAGHYPGSFCLAPDRALALLLDVLEEIHRNGFDKILVVNGHGGNHGLMEMLIDTLITRDPGYTLYTVADPTQSSLLTQQEKAQIDDLYESDVFGHADEAETSTIMHLCPEDVKMDAPINTRPLHRFDIPGVRTPYWWYAINPRHQCGDPRKATAEKGKRSFEITVRALARTLAAVKADTVGPALRESFQASFRKPIDAWEE